jgi:hypothetical protein
MFPIVYSVMTRLAFKSSSAQTAERIPVLLLDRFPAVLFQGNDLLFKRLVVAASA